MRLHRHVSVQVVQCTISLLAAVPTTLVHALDFFIAPSGTFVLLRARDWHERVYGGERVAALEKTRQSSVPIGVRIRADALNASTYGRGTRDVVRDHGRRSAARGCR
jgi:hypothetical protein